MINTTITGTQSGIVVSPAPASVLVFSGYSIDHGGARRETSRVTAQDPYGNTATGYTGTIHFESSDLQATAGAGLPPDYTFTTGAGEDNGVHTFSATFKTAGTQSITVRDTVNGTIPGTEAGIAVSPATASQLVFGQQPTSATAGVAVSPARDSHDRRRIRQRDHERQPAVTLTLLGGTFDGGSSSIDRERIERHCDVQRDQD